MFEGLKKAAGLPPDGAMPQPSAPTGSFGGQAAPSSSAKQHGAQAAGVKWPPIVVPGGRGAGHDAFDVVLHSSNSQKIAVIKAVRELTGLGLKEAKGMVEDTPSVILSGVSEGYANKGRERLEEAGGTASVVSSLR